MNKKKMAIIGSGIAGLSSSLFLSKDFEVHLFEKNNLLGGHTRTIHFNDDFNKPQAIDTGFIVFNDRNYPDLVSFFKYLDVKTENSEMSFSVSCNSPKLEYGGSSLSSIFAERKNIFSIKFIKLLFEIRRLYNLGRDLHTNNIYENLTIEEFLSKNNFSKNVRDFHIYPMISSIWSSNNKDVKNFPFVSFINFFNNHGLFDLFNRPKWKFVSGGSYKYVDSLIKKNLFKYYTNYKIKKITRENNKIQLISENNNLYTYDKIVFATHADQAMNLLDELSSDEKSILNSFKYTKNSAYLHTDEKLMPNSKLAWSSWNFLQNFDEKNNFALTYWMNKLQKINKNKNYFVSVNPNFEPDNIIDQTLFEHPVFNMETLKSQKKLGSIQGKKNTFYCGSYCGYGFHEDGIQSAAYIAKQLNIILPWKRSVEFKNRLNY